MNMNKNYENKCRIKGKNTCARLNHVRGYICINKKTKLGNVNTFKPLEWNLFDVVFTSDTFTNILDAIISKQLLS